MSGLLAGIPRPSGDPATARAAGHSHRASGRELAAVSRSLIAVVQSLTDSQWAGVAATASSHCAVAFAGALSQAGDAADRAGQALLSYADALATAQGQWDHASRLAGEALSDEAAYRSQAEQQALTLEQQATTGDLGAVHMAQQIRNEAATWTSPLRSRAISLATEAVHLAKQAATTAASAVDGAAGQLASPPPAPQPVDGHPVTPKAVWDWFNTWVLGYGSNAWGLGTTPSALVAGARLIGAERGAAALPQDLRVLFSETVGPMGLAYDRGEVSLAELAGRASRWQSSATLFEGDAAAQVAERTKSFLAGGLPETKAFEVLGRTSEGLGVIGDVATLINPGGHSTTENVLNRTAAGANLAGMAGIEAGALGLDAAVGWVPVAGQVVVIGTGLYLAGDWAYNTFQPFHDGVDAVGHWATHDVPDFFTNTVPDAAGSVLHGAEHLVSDLNPFD